MVIGDVDDNVDDVVDDDDDDDDNYCQKPPALKAWKDFGGIHANSLSRK